MTFAVPNPKGGGFEERYWSPVNTPVIGGDKEIIYIIHRVEDVTEFVRLKKLELEQGKIAEQLRVRADQMEAEIYIRAQELQTANEELRATQAEIHRLNADLEHRVLRRTKELESANKKLESEIAERKRAEKALEAQNDIVEAANRAKDHFFAILSHELRTPLTPVLSSIDALEYDKNRTEEEKSTLAMMRRNVMLEARLIDDLLDVTRIGKGKLQLQIESVDAHQLIHNVAEICQREIQSKKIDLKLDLSAKNYFVRGDSAKLQQVIWNLVRNAIKFNRAGGSIAISSSNEKPKELTLNFRDTGIGIEPGLLKTIFNPFEQGERSITRKYGGLGLGLSISKGLAAAQGGSLSAASDGLDKGSVFFLKLNTAPKPRANGNVEVKVSNSERKHSIILLVEDHDDTRGALQRLLTRRGYFVITAGSVAEALEVGRQKKFDLLISDIGLPDGSGVEVMTHLRQLQPIKGIALSGFGMESDRQKSREAGFSEHLIKPIDFEKLESIIQKI